MKRSIGVGLLAAATVTWGFETAAAKYGVAAIAPMTALVVQLLAATGVLWIVVLVRRAPLPTR